MRQANWHEVGGNAVQLKGTEEQARAEHAGAGEGELPSGGRGSGSLDQPCHEQALYPPVASIARPRKRAGSGGAS